MEYAIKIENLTKSYPAVLALDKISFSVEKGQVHGFLGPNGAGKTTTMKILAKILPPSKGSIKVLGMDYQDAKYEEIIKLSIGFLPENPPLYNDMDVTEYLKLVGAIHDIKGKDLLYHVDAVMEQVDLAHMSKRLIGNLSKGYKQRVGLAQALIFKPQILILDEPTSGLDPAAIKDLRKLIQDLKEQMTILLSSHQLHEVTINCTDITIINQGKIAISGPINDVLKKFRTYECIDARVRNWNTKIEKEIKDIDFVTAVSSEMRDELFQVQITTDGNVATDNSLEILSSKLVQNSCGLLYFKQKEGQLEDIFLNLTEET